MSFELAHTAFIEEHLARRAGERKGRLLRGHNFAEKLFLKQVWWPLFASLDNLHPEYEIYDWNRKSQFLDFAYLTPPGRFGIECDGFQSHIKEMDREKFSYALNRDTFLTGMGWRMIHFSFDDIQNRPEVCQMLLQLVISPHLIRPTSATSLTPVEKEVLRLAINLSRPIRPKDIINGFKVNFRTARNLLISLVEKGVLHKKPADGAYARYYELSDGAWQRLL
jgi:DNA-binding CsgD family transcriptional regulator